MASSCCCHLNKIYQLRLPRYKFWKFLIQTKEWIWNNLIISNVLAFTITWWLLFSDKKSKNTTKKTEKGPEVCILNVTKNSLYAKLPYTTFTEITTEYYVSTTGVCLLKELPFCMGLGVMSLLLKYNVARKKILEQRATSKNCVDNVVTLKSAPYMTPLPNACNINNLSDEILLLILSNLNSQNLFSASR